MQGGAFLAPGTTKIFISAISDNEHSTFNTKPESVRAEPACRAARFTIAPDKWLRISGGPHHNQVPSSPLSVRIRSAYYLYN